MSTLKPHSSILFLESEDAIASGAVAWSKEPRYHKKQKHIERKYHLIRDIIKEETQ